MSCKAWSSGLNERGGRISMKGISSTSAPSERSRSESSRACERARLTRMRQPCSGLVCCLSLRAFPTAAHIMAVAVPPLRCRKHPAESGQLLGAEALPPHFRRAFPDADLPESHAIPVSHPVARLLRSTPALLQLFLLTLRSAPGSLRPKPSTVPARSWWWPAQQR